MRFLLPLVCVAAALLPLAAGAEEKPRPLMRDFIGLCVHTVTFKPEVYQPVTKLLRDYHPYDWDVGKETDFATTFPMARNKVDWGKLYGSWKAAGYRTEASILFDNFDPKTWRDLPRDARAYGKSFAEYFGPSKSGLLEAIEIGNEPGKYDDATYRTLFEAMAGGAREGDPKLQIATCAANLGPSGRYSKSVDLLQGLESLYDIVNIHNYPEVEGWPTWRRSYPEDPGIKFLSDIDHVLKWRDEHAASKEVWLTEFGYDASTKPAPPAGDFARWVSSTETEQAYWTVRAFLVLAATGLDRAYLFYFNDKDEAQLHGSSGLTRNYEPKPAFHAVAHLQATLGDYRFLKAHRPLGDDRFLKAHRQSAQQDYVYEFQHGTDPTRRVFVAWLPKGESRAATLPTGELRVVKAERTPLKPGAAESVTTTPAPGGGTQVEIGEAPVFLWLQP